MTFGNMIFGNMTYGNMAFGNMWKHGICKHGLLSETREAVASGWGTNVTKRVLVKAILKARGGRKRCSLAANDAR